MKTLQKAPFMHYTFNRPPLFVFVTWPLTNGGTTGSQGVARAELPVSTSFHDGTVPRPRRLLGWPLATCGH